MTSETYTAEMVWDAAMQNERDSAHEENREIADSRYEASRNIGLYADIFGVPVSEAIAYARTQYKDFDWAVNHK